MTAPSLLRARADEFVAAASLLTRLPIARIAANVGPAELIRSVWAFPLVGAAIGVVGAACFAIADALGVPPSLAAASAMIATVLATGAIHEDGFADFADGLAGRSPEARLAIMRDSRIGTYGAIALIVSFGVRAAAVAVLAQPLLVFAALVATGATGRATMAVVMAAVPPARADGLSAGIGRPTLGPAIAAVAIAALVAFLTVGRHSTVVVGVLAAVVAFVVGGLAQRRLGGQTGDVLGACGQIAEILGLAALASLLP